MCLMSGASGISSKLIEPYAANENGALFFGEVSAKACAEKLGIESISKSYVRIVERPLHIPR